MEETKPVCSLEEGCLFRQLGVIPVPIPVAPSFTNLQIWQMRWVVGALAGLFFFVIAIACFFMFYPFKTVTFVEPIKVTNPRPAPDKQPQVGKHGVVDMTIYYEKFTNAPSLIVCTLIRKYKDGSMVVLDSNTRTAHRKIGKGTTYAHYFLTGGNNLPGTDTHVVFSIFYTLYGFRPIMVRFETEPFEITP